MKSITWFTVLWTALVAGLHAPYNGIPLFCAVILWIVFILLVLVGLAKVGSSDKEFYNEFMKKKPGVYTRFTANAGRLVMLASVPIMVTGGQPILGALFLLWALITFYVVHEKIKRIKTELEKAGKAEP